jgi:hypothetical protein
MPLGGRNRLAGYDKIYFYLGKSNFGVMQK